jgi:hypothetical protein
MVCGDVKWTLVVKMVPVTGLNERGRKTSFLNMNDWKKSLIVNIKIYCHMKLY